MLSFSLSSLSFSTDVDTVGAISTWFLGFTITMHVSFSVLFSFSVDFLVKFLCKCDNPALGLMLLANERSRRIEMCVGGDSGGLLSPNFNFNWPSESVFLIDLSCSDRMVVVDDGTDVIKSSLFFLNASLVVPFMIPETRVYITVLYKGKRKYNVF